MNKQQAKVKVKAEIRFCTYACVYTCLSMKEAA
jgi:hypothetical protein